MSFLQSWRVILSWLRAITVLLEDLTSHTTDAAGVLVLDDDRGEAVGDVHPLEAREKAAWLTPVPGGVGPLTIAQLLRNTLVGLVLATVGLATFWGVHIYGRELLRDLVEKQYAWSSKFKILETELLSLIDSSKC